MMSLSIHSLRRGGSGQRGLYHRLSQLIHPLTGFAGGGEDLGKSGRVATRLLKRARFDLNELGRLDLVGLGEDESIADRRVVEHLHDLAVDVLEPVTAVDED